MKKRGLLYPQDWAVALIVCAVLFFLWYFVEEYDCGGDDECVQQCVVKGNSLSYCTDLIEG